MTEYEKKYLESMNRGPDPIHVADNMTEAEYNLEVIRYIKEAIKNQTVYLRKDIERCEAFLDEIKYEYEIEDAWNKREREGEAASND